MKGPTAVTDDGASSFLEAGDRARTGDPQLGKLMLYQLSYARDPGNLFRAGQPLKVARP